MSINKQYIFVPWVRQGVAKQISTVDGLGSNTATGEQLRASIESTLTWNTSNTETKTIGVVGPADIQSISEDAILNIEPKHRVDDVEANYLPFIEFYEEDFPWRFSPLKHSGEKLRPWLALVVLKEEEFTTSNIKGQMPYFSLKSEVNFNEVFHKKEDHYAWAHVQFNPLSDADFGGGNTNLSEAERLALIKAKIKEDPDLAYSRLMCPRKLDKDTEYTAFLIPAFETGRLAGLGRDASTTSTQQASWLNEDPSGAFDIGIKDFPYYKHWTFKTSEYGDFETLVKKLVPRQVDATKGSRPMDIQKTGFNIDTTYSLSVGLEGALRPPTYTHPAWPEEQLDETGAVEYTDQGYIDRLKDVINVGTELTEVDPSFGTLSNSPYGGTITNDPIVSPPRYGQWYKKVSKVQADPSLSWFEELNLNPAYRAVAALGTKVVQTNQESYMERAWEQLGAVELANQKIRQAELAKWVTESLVRKNIKPVSESRLLNIASPIISKVKEGGVPISKTIKESVVPNATVDAGFRKVMRSGNKSLKKSAGVSQTVGQAFSNPVLSFDTDLSASPTTTAETYALNEDLTTAPGSISIPGGASASYTNYIQTNMQAFLDSIPNEEVLDSISASITPIKDKINLRMDPLNTSSAHAKKLSSRIKVLNSSGTLDNYSHQKPIMAHPEFKDSMYEELKKIDQEYLVPNLDAFPNNTVTLLETNQKFIEAYFAGLNHEMSRELLWREYPTDQRGTYFKHFWDKSDSDDTEQKDITVMSGWDTPSLLGQHPGDSSAVAGHIVLFVRGDLFKKFPDALVYAHMAKNPAIVSGSSTVARELKETDSTTQKRPLFRVDLEPDITVIGFDLTEEQVRTGGADENGWYFVFAERPGKPRFGLDDEDSAPPLPTYPETPSWNDLYWQHLTGDTHLDVASNAGNSIINTIDGVSPGQAWGASSADMASITYQRPVIVGIHADKMLPDA